MVQDNDWPPVAQLSFDRHIIGIGDNESNLEFYFIFNDGSHKTNSDPSKFKEVTIKPEGSNIRRVRVQFYDNNMHWNGCFTGIEFYDDFEQLILQAGRITQYGPKNFVHEFILDDGERLCGIKSGLRNENVQRHWDLQFVIGRMDWLFNFK